MNSAEARKLISLYLKTLYFSKETIQMKEEFLVSFCSYLEEHEDLQGNWSFNHVKALKFKDILFRIPIDTPIVSNYLSYLNDKVGTRTYNNTLSTLKSFFDFLIDVKVLNDNPALELRPKKEIQRDMSNFRLTYDETIQLLCGMYQFNKHKVRNFTLALLLLSSSTRPGEAINIKEEDIFLDRNIICVDGKSNERNRLIGPGLKITIQALLNDPLRAEYLKNSPEKYLFYSEKGGAWSTRDINKLLKATAQLAGINKPISTYWLRRTYASALVMSGFSINEVQKLFNHDSITSTEHYTGNQGSDSKLIRQTLNSCSVNITLETLVRNQIKQVKALSPSNCLHSK